MTPADWLLIARAAPAVKDAILAIVKGFAARDEKAVRKATEATLRLAFELRQDLPKR